MILVDKPTDNLQSDKGKDIMELFKRLNQDGTTIIQVTHSVRRQRKRKNNIFGLGCGAQTQLLRFAELAP